MRARRAKADTVRIKSGQLEAGGMSGKLIINHLKYGIALGANCLC